MYRVEIGLASLSKVNAFFICHGFSALKSMGLLILNHCAIFFLSKVEYKVGLTSIRLATDSRP